MPKLTDQSIDKESVFEEIVKLSIYLSLSKYSIWVWYWN